MSAATHRTTRKWAEARFRYLADVCKGSLPPSEDKAGLNAEGIPYLTMEYLRGEISEPTLVSIDPDLLLASDDDILLLWDGSNAGEFLRAKRGVVSSTTALVTPKSMKSIDPTFFFWACKGQEDRVRAETVGMGIPHVNGEFLANLRIQLPNLNQQRAIADYLDRETVRLDALVEEKERLLDLLAEKRRALITRAVTRGINPNVPLRDSGISWLGEIPAHWEIWKLGHSAAVGNGSTPSRSNAAYWTEGTIPWLRSSVVNQDEVTKADEFVTPAAMRECNLPLVEKGSVLIAIVGQGKTRGQAAVLSCDAAINQNLAFVAPDCSRLSTWFLRWIFFAAYEYIRSVSDDAGGPKGILTCEDVANLRIPIPPIDEQYAINARIATLSAKINQLRIATECSIRLTKERRAAVITAAVTGKIEMRNGEAVQPARRTTCQEKVKA